MPKGKLETMLAIAKRAEKMNLVANDRVTLMMDLEFSDREFNLRLDELLKADNFNFAHDIVGIQNNINRQSFKMENYFVPRFASHKTMGGN